MNLLTFSRIADTATKSENFPPSTNPLMRIPFLLKSFIESMAAIGITHVDVSLFSDGPLPADILTEGAPFPLVHDWNHKGIKTISNNLIVDTSIPNSTNYVETVKDENKTAL